MVESENHLHTYDGVRTIMFPSGDLGLALEIGSIANGISILDGMKVGMIDLTGFLIYHPEMGATIYWKTLDLVEDLGEL